MDKKTSPVTQLVYLDNCIMEHNQGNAIKYSLATMNKVDVDVRVWTYFTIVVNLTQMHGCCIDFITSLPGCFLFNFINILSTLKPNTKQCTKIVVKTCVNKFFICSDLN